MDIFASITYVEITSQTLGINLLTCQILLVRLHSIAFESPSCKSLPTRTHVTTPSHSLLPCSTCQASRAFLAFHLAQQQTENLLTHRRASQHLLGLSLSRHRPHPHFLFYIIATALSPNNDNRYHHLLRTSDNDNYNSTGRYQQLTHTRHK